MRQNSRNGELQIKWRDNKSYEPGWFLVLSFLYQLVLGLRSTGSWCQKERKHKRQVKLGCVGRAIFPDSRLVKRSQLLLAWRWTARSKVRGCTLLADHSRHEKLRTMICGRCCVNRDETYRTWSDSAIGLCNFLFRHVILALGKESHKKLDDCDLSESASQHDDCRTLLTSIQKH